MQAGQWPAGRKTVKGKGLLLRKGRMNLEQETIAKKKKKETIAVTKVVGGLGCLGAWSLGGMKTEAWK